MKIAIISNSPSRSTGFGQQTKLLAQGFTERGHKVVIICEPQPYLPENSFPWEEIKTEAYDSKSVDKILAEVRPDVAIFFDAAQRIHEWMNIKVAPANIPIYYWFPYEGSSIPEDYRDMFYGLKPGALIHLSYFSQRMWERSESDRVIYHAVNPAFRPLEIPKSRLRKKWSKIWKTPIFPDAPLIININRNFWHKGWDLCLDYVRRMVEINPDIQFLAHTVSVVDEARGGFNLPRIARTFGIEDNVIFSGFDWRKPLDVEDLNEIINMADLRVDASHGEGFGLTTLECAVAGLPQILSDHTTMKEIVGERYAGIVRPVSTRFSVGTSWRVPNIEKFVARTEHFLDHPGEFQYDADFSVFSVDSMITAWEEVFAQDLQDDYWKTHRYGYRAQHVLRGARQSVARLAQLLKLSILEIGPYDGETIEWANQFGVPIHAIADSSTGHEKRDKFITIQGLEESWREAGMLVMTDEQDSFADMPRFVFDRFASYPWICARLQDRFKWGAPRISADQMRAIFEGCGHQRRQDIELMVKKKLPFFDYEIWAQTSETPEALSSF